MPAYSGVYTLVNKDKYKGDPSEVHWRSSWERLTFKWCDLNPDVLWWSSEKHLVPYKCKTDGKVHTYYTDLSVGLTNGKTLLVEIKPKYQTLRPLKKNKSKERFTREVMVWAKNVSKWEAATSYANSKGMSFRIWTEETLWKLGINVKN